MLNLIPILPYVLLSAAATAFGLALYLQRRSSRSSVGWISLCVAACGIWAMLDGLAILIDAPATQDFLRRAASPAILASTFCFFRFACSYAQHQEWWEVARRPIIAAITVNLTLILTNPWHQWIWRPSHWIDLGFAQYPVMNLGPAFYALQLPLTYGLVVAGMVILLAQAAALQAFYVRRTAMLVIGSATPVVVNVFALTNRTGGIDLTAVALLLSFAAVAWVTVRDRLLEVMPTVRSQLFREHRDAVLVIDPQFRVLDLNPAARRLLGRDTADAQSGFQGRDIASVLPMWTEVSQAVLAADGRGVEVNLNARVLELRSTAVHDEKQRLIGRLLVLRDITETVLLIRELAAYARTVAHDLKNPLAAAIGYIDLARMTAPQIETTAGPQLDLAHNTCEQMARIIQSLLKARTTGSRNP